MLIEYDVKVEESKSKVKSLIDKIDKKLKSAQKNFKFFLTTMQKSEEKIDHKVCVWICEMKFLSSAMKLSQIQQSLGGAVKDIWEDALRLENTRYMCIKKAMKEYLALQSSVFMFENLNALKSIEEIEENQGESLSDRKLFRPEELSMLSELGIEDNYIENLSIWLPKPVSDFDWILKEGFIYMENGVFQQWQECYGVVVKSRFLHIFTAKPELPFKKPMESLYLARAKLMVSQNSDTYVEITEQNKTGFFGKLVLSKQVVIKTKDPQVLYEWLELIQSLTSND
jgi:hypothetical protein